MSTVSPLPTVGVIAQQLDKSLHCVEYIIRARQIQPSGIAGNCRVFSAEAVQQIAAELRQVDEKRGLRT